MFDKFTLQNLADKENNIMRRCSFIIQTSDKNSFFCPIQVFNCAICFFYNFARQIVLILYPGRSKHALPLYKKLLHRIDPMVSTQTLFYYSFRSFRRHGRARSARTSRGFVLYSARSRGFEKLEGL